MFSVMYVAPDGCSQFLRYQPGGSSGYNPGSGVDPLSDGDICLRDAALMQQLGVNALRVYNVDPAINHDMCASIFNEVIFFVVTIILSANTCRLGSTY